MSKIYVCILVLAVGCMTPSLYAQPFLTLQTGFTQELFGSAPSFFGGVGFAPNGDVWVDRCAGSGSPLFRFELGATTTVNGTTIHPQAAGSPFPSNAGCGLTNHPDGTMYSNTGIGVVNLDANTGAQLRPAFGTGGNALGIAVDPQTGNLVYVGGDGTIRYVNSAFTSAGVFSVATTGNFVDGIFFDPSGNYLFMSNRSPAFRLTIINRSGALVQHVPMASEPDGIAFHVNPTFVVTSNTNGTMTRFDFPANDFTQTPTATAFATGGFRGDLSQVGADGCLYATQAGTRYNNGVTSGDNSVVRICPNFVPPPGVNPATGRMTGGGSVITADGSRVTHGMELHCNKNSVPNNLQVNWDRGNTFHLEALAAVVCFTDNAIDSNPPAAGFNTMIGSGSGVYNGTAGATVEFTFTDAGEPGAQDTARLVIKDSGSNTVLSVTATLDRGNQQAHAQ